MAALATPTILLGILSTHGYRQGALTRRPGRAGAGGEVMLIVYKLQLLYCPTCDRVVSHRVLMSGDLLVCIHCGRES